MKKLIATLGMFTLIGVGNAYGANYEQSIKSLVSYGAKCEEKANIHKTIRKDWKRLGAKKICEIFEGKRIGYTDYSKEGEGAVYFYDILGNPCRVSHLDGKVETHSLSGFSQEKKSICGKMGNMLGQIAHLKNTGERR